MFSKPSKRKFIANSLFIPVSSSASEKKLPGETENSSQAPPLPPAEECAGESVPKKESEAPGDLGQTAEGLADLTTLVEQVLDERSFSEMFLFDKKVQEQAALSLRRDLSGLVLDSSLQPPEEPHSKRRPDKIFDESATFPSRDRHASDLGKIVNELKRYAVPQPPPPKPQASPAQNSQPGIKPSPRPRSPTKHSKQQSCQLQGFRVPPPRQPQPSLKRDSRPAEVISTRSKSSSHKLLDLDYRSTVQRAPSLLAEQSETELPPRFRSVSFPSYTELFPQVEIKQRMRQRDPAESEAPADLEQDFAAPEDFTEILRLKESIRRRKEEEVRREQVFYERTIESFLTSLVYELHPVDGRFSCYCGRQTCAKHFASYQDKSLHVLADLGVASFVCSLCGRFFLEKSSLYNHACT